MSSALKEKPLQAEKEAEQPEPEKQRPFYITDAVSSVQGFKNFVRYKFSAEQLYGSIFLLFVIYGNVQGFKAAWNRQGVADGKDPASLSAMVNKKNINAVITSFMMLGINLWAFLSSRSAVPPEGNTYKERIADVVKHPERSHEQFKYLITLFSLFIGEWGHIKYGFTSAGTAEERKTKKMQALITPITMYLTFTTLFEDKRKRVKKNPASSHEGAEQHPPAFHSGQSKILQSKWLYPLRVMRDAWHHNPRLIISSALSLTLSLLVLNEGATKRRSMLQRLDNATQIGSEAWGEMRQKLEGEKGAMNDKEVLSAIKEMKSNKMIESSSLIKKGALNFLLNIAGMFYNFDQLYKGMRTYQNIPPSSFQAAEKAKNVPAGGVSR